MHGNLDGSVTVPAVVRQLVDEVRSLASDESRHLLAHASPSERAGWVVGLQRLADAVAVASLSAVAAFDAGGDGQVLHGAASTQAWLRGACRVTGAEASERVRIARASRGLLGDAVTKVGDGLLTYDHLRAVERGVRHIPETQRPAAVHVLTDLAEVGSVTDVRTAGKHLQYVVDPDGSLTDSEQQFDRRYLTLAPLMDQMTALDGLLDAESAALLSAALEPFLVPADPGDTRTAAQRRADGLVQIVASAADQALLPVVGGQRPNLQVIVDPRVQRPSVEDRRAGGGQTDHDLKGAADALRPGRLPQTPGGSAFLHPHGVARVACDAQLTALLLDEHGAVVDLGRTRRLFSAQQRRLLSARDGGCRFPGCDRPPAHTDAHHLVSWLDGGPTDVTNAVLLCRHHHRAVHEGGWSLNVTDPERGTHGPVTMIGPTGQRLTSTPRGP